MKQHVCAAAIGRCFVVSGSYLPASKLLQNVSEARRS
jgi:hypothetical protein